MVISLHIILYGAPYHSAAFLLFYCPLSKMIFFAPQALKKSRANVIISRYFSFPTLYFPHKISCRETHYHNIEYRPPCNLYGPPYSLYGPSYKNCKKFDFSPYKSHIIRFHTQKTKNSKLY